MKKKTIGVIICISALVYCFEETQFFGSHWKPTTPEEVIADGLALVILAIGMSMWGK